jgi:hypothetical protein
MSNLRYFHALCSRDVKINLIFSAFTSRAISSLDANKKTMLFFTVFLLLPSELILCLVQQLQKCVFSFLVYY